MALVAHKGGKDMQVALANHDGNGSSSDSEASDPLSKLNPEQIRRLEERKKRLDRYKVIEKSNNDTQ